MQYTEYYAMKKPEDTDNVAISDIDDNMDTIDGQLHEMSLEIAEVSSDITTASESVTALNSEAETLNREFLNLNDTGVIVTSVQWGYIVDNAYCLRVGYSDGTLEFLPIIKITSEAETYYSVPIIVTLDGISWEDFNDLEPTATLNITRDTVDGEQGTWTDGTVTKSIDISGIEYSTIIKFQGTRGYAFDVTLDDESNFTTKVITTKDGETYQTNELGNEIVVASYSIVVIAITYTETEEETE